VVRLRRGEALNGRCDGADDYWNVIQGAVMLQTLLPDGRRQVAYFGFPGEMLSARLDPRFDAFGFQAVCETLLCRVSESAVAELCTDGTLAEQFLSEAYARIAQAGLHSVVLGRMTAGERIATFLCELIFRSGERLCDDTTFLLPMSREEIADYLGLNSETVSRTFTRLKKAGILELPKTDRARLKNAMALVEMVPFESIEDICPSVAGNRSPGGAASIDPGGRRALGPLSLVGARS
jgi:CRP/FNR family transcriptional regulator